MDRSGSSAERVVTAPDGCVVDEEWIDHTVVIRVSGVLDVLTSPKLEAGVAAALQKHPNAVVVDLTEVDFLASAGMGVLVSARRRIAGRIGFAVVASGSATSRPLKLVGLADALGLYPSVDEACAALGE